MIALLFYNLTVLISALRIRYLAGKPDRRQTPWWRLNSVELLAAVSAYFFPFGTGELARAGIWRSLAGVPLARMGIVLVQLRVVDVTWLALAIVLAASTGSLGAHPSIQYLVLPLSWAGALLLLLLVFSAWRGRKLFAKLVGWMARAAERVRHGWGPRIERWAMNALRPEESGNPTRYGLALGAFATCYWLSDFLFYYSVARALIPHITPGEMIGVFAASCAIAVSPFRGVADIGSHEVAWAMPLIMLGYQRADALSYAAAAHLLMAGIFLALLPIASIIAFWPGSPKPQAS